MSAFADVPYLSPQTHRDGSRCLVVVRLLAVHETVQQLGVDGGCQSDLDLEHLGWASGVGPAVGLRQRYIELNGR